MEKEKNAFTLIELMAVIIILSLIAILTFPNIVNQIKKTKSSNNKMIEDIVITAAKKYVNDNKNDYNSDAYCIKVKELLDTNYIKEGIVKASSDNLYNKYIIYHNNTYIVTNEGYEQIEYIESTGTQYIDTNYIPKMNTRLQLDIKFSGSFNTSCTTIFSSNNFKTSVFSLNFGGDVNQYNTLFPWIDKPYVKGGRIENFNITNDIRENRNIIIMQSGSISYGAVSRVLSTKTTDNDLSLILFGGYQSNGSICSFNAYDNMYVYGLKLYEGDILKRDYIPALDYKGIACLYEKVQGKFYYNQGTGEFLYG